MSGERSRKNKKAVVMIEWNGRGDARTGQLRDLLHDCAASPANDQAARLIEAARLLRVPEDVAKVTAMVACGAYESAAHVVLGPDRPFLVSRGANGLCLASALMRNRDRWVDGGEATAEGATPALAMLAALAAALLAEEDQAGSRTRFAASTNLARLH
jgi:hypothetical protein